MFGNSHVFAAIPRIPAARARIRWYTHVLGCLELPSQYRNSEYQIAYYSRHYIAAPGRPSPVPPSQKYV